MTADTPPPAPPAPPGGLTAGRWYRWVVALIVLLVAAEVTSRFDDWLFFGTPLLASPDRESDLTVHDEHGIHGRPGGRFRKWKLNGLGFRGAEVEERPAPGMVRVLVLGASETFGLYESEGNEYPAVLGRLLAEQSHGKVEVINGAMAGISVRSMVPYWRKWLARLRPDVVVIYPSPLFYVDDEPPKEPPETPPVAGRPGLRSRFGERIFDTLRRFTLLRWLRQEMLTRSRDDTFPEVPADRLERFTSDLRSLVETIRTDGAEPVLLTHAIKASNPPRPEDTNDLKAMQVFFPRATPEILVAFEEAAANAERTLARQEKVPLIDPAQFNGQRKLFADLVHWNDDGSREFADFLAAELTPLLPRPRAATPLPR
jgi:lysophospholipase L1-like esterase